MKIPFVDLQAQYRSIKTEIDQAVQKVLDQSAFVQGPFVESFEENFAKKNGSKFCVAVSSGTSALHLAMWSLGIKTGDEVISQIESYRKTHGRLPETLENVGFLDPNPRVFYQTTGKDQYCVWFETRMGEAETYYSRTKKWEDTDCGMDSFVFHK